MVFSKGCRTKKIVKESAPSAQPQLFNVPAIEFPKSQFMDFIASKLVDEATQLTDFVERLERYDAGASDVAELNPERKWELVSAYQKSIRRGHAAIAHEMAATLLHGDQDTITYFWRRIAVVAGEDIGLANPKLVAFVLLSSQFFSPRKFPTLQSKVVSFITQEMAESLKDRTLCDFAVINMWASKGYAGGPKAEEIINRVQECDALAKACASNKDRQPYWARFSGRSELLNYLLVQDYRTEGMTRYVGLALEFMRDGVERELCRPDMPDVTPPPMLRGIPAYAFDMHTRTGKRSLLRFSEYPPVKSYLPIGTERLGALGWGLFYVESGKLDRKLGFPKRVCIERLSCRLALTAQGIKPSKVGSFLDVVKEALPVLIGIRIAVVHEAYRARPATNVSRPQK